MMRYIFAPDYAVVLSNFAQLCGLNDVYTIFATADSLQKEYEPKIHLKLTFHHMEHILNTPASQYHLELY